MSESFPPSVHYFQNGAGVNPNLPHPTFGNAGSVMNVAVSNNVQNTNLMNTIGHNCNNNLVSSDESLLPNHGVFSTSELNAPQYSTDEFRMFNFKVARCSKRFVHDWRSCPFAHPTENARRRDPRLVKYLPVPCPDYKRGICMRGDNCPYSHGVYECWLHPAKYKTQLCKEGPHCHRPVCFFAHSVNDLRQPTHMWNDTDGVDGESTAQILLSGNQQSSMVVEQSANSNHCESSQSCSIDEKLNNLQALKNTETESRSEKCDVEAENNAAISDGDITSDASAESCTPSDILEPSTNQSINGLEYQKLNCNDDRSSEQNDTVYASYDAAEIEGRDKIDTLVLENGHESKTDKTGIEQNFSNPADNPPSRLSLDAPLSPSAPESSWSQGIAASATAAAALAGIPVNEQPLLPNQGPRMSNAVARKLGLAPPRSQASGNTSDTRFGRREGQNSPRGSMDSLGGLSGLASPTYAQVQHHRGSMDSAMASYRNLQSSNGIGVSSSAGSQASQQPTMQSNGISAGNCGVPVSYQDQSHSIHPALLNLVAANLNGQLNQPLQPKEYHTGSLPASFSSSVPLMHQINAVDGANTYMVLQQQKMHANQNIQGAADSGYCSVGSTENQKTTCDIDGNVANNIANLMNTLNQLSLGMNGFHPQSSQGQHIQLNQSGHAALHNASGKSVDAITGIPHRGSSDGMLGASAVPYLNAEAQNNEYEFAVRGKESIAQNGGDGKNVLRGSDRFHLPQDLSIDMFQHFHQSMKKEDGI